MIPPPIPDDEAQRLADLRALRILDTPPEERFDRIARLAAFLYDVPIAYIAMVDADRQWFKARCGLTTDQTGREVSFCGYAILGDEAMVVPDATRDERFADNPLVVGDPKIRFYVGQPLRGPRGYKVGTLCIADVRPRDVSPRELETLKRLAALTETQLELVDLVSTQRELIHTQKRLIDTQARLAAELREAEAYVRSLLPRKLTDGPVRTDYELVASSRLGGDLFGYHWLDARPRSRLAMYLLDVCGHGVGASLLSVTVSNVLRRQTLPEVSFADPAAVLSALNRAFPMEEHQGRFITAWYGVYDPAGRVLRYASAGHPPVIALGLSDRPELLCEAGLVLGVDRQARYANDERTMPPGSRLWVYSDGAFEVQSPEDGFLGIDGLARLAAESAELPVRVEYVTGKLREFQGRDDFQDDVSLLEVTFP